MRLYNIRAATQPCNMEFANFTRGVWFDGVENGNQPKNRQENEGKRRGFPPPSKESLVSRPNPKKIM